MKKKDELEGLNPLNKDEVQILERIMEPVDFEEFIGEMEARGLLVPGVTPSIGTRILTFLARPFLAIGRGFAKIGWHLWGKRRHEKNVRKGMDRWRHLAGVDEPESHDGFNAFRPERIGYLGYGADSALHEHIIETRVVREPLPKPDTDDSGLN